MINTRELEKKWIQYKIKKTLPYALSFAGLAFISIAFLLYSLYFTPTKKIQNNVKKPIQQIKPQKTKEPKIIENVKVVELHNDNQMLLTPSLSFVDKFQKSVTPYYQEKNTHYSKKTTQRKKKKNRVKRKKIVTTVKEEIEIINPILVQSNNSKPIKIKRDSQKNNIELIVERFKKNNNPKLSLYIAKKYYNDKKYHKAYNYALITNSLNNKIELSWIIFAKSLVKLGEKEMAIKTLKRYIKSSRSLKARTLLDAINTGKFR